jgi:hypothetical protein
MWRNCVNIAHMNINYTNFVDFFLYVKDIEHQPIVSFLLVYLSALCRSLATSAIDIINSFILCVLCQQAQTYKIPQRKEKQIIKPYACI